jgi:hypothetical protein
MNTILQSIHLHSALWTLASCIVISNAVNAMPEPVLTSSNFYRWFFTFSHGLALQIGRFLNKGVSENDKIITH